VFFRDEIRGVQAEEGSVLKSRPESGLDCLTCAGFTRQRYSVCLELNTAAIAVDSDRNLAHTSG